jgi:hypothetical protein
MSFWFVSTTRPYVRGSRQEADWRLTECTSEQAAKEIASRALIDGLRVEAGTMPGVEPKVRVGWPAAHRWAQSSNEGAIMSLQRRLVEFTAQRAARISAPAQELPRV